MLPMLRRAAAARRPRWSARSLPSSPCPFSSATALPREAAPPPTPPIYETVIGLELHVQVGRGEGRECVCGGGGAVVPRSSRLPCPLHSHPCVNPSPPTHTLLPRPAPPSPPPQVKAATKLFSRAPADVGAAPNTHGESEAARPGERAERASSQTRRASGASELSGCAGGAPHRAPHPASGSELSG